MLIYGSSYPDVFKILISKMEASDVASIEIIDDLLFGNKESFMGFPIVGDEARLAKYSKDSKIINNVHASPAARFKVFSKIEKYGLDVTSVVANGLDLNFVSIGSGVFVHSNVNFGSNVVIGDGVSIKLGATISHDVQLNTFSFVGPGSTLCGHVNVGRGAYIGAGAIVKERVNIGEGAVVGAGALVLSDVEPWTTVVGSPAKFLKKNVFFDYGYAK